MKKLLNFFFVLFVFLIKPTVQNNDRNTAPALKILNREKRFAFLRPRPITVTRMQMRRPTMTIPPPISTTATTTPSIFGMFGDTQNHNNPFADLGLGPSYLASDPFLLFDSDPNNALRTFVSSPYESEDDVNKTLKLAGSDLPFMGRVLMRISENELGNICGNEWDFRDAMVVCRELGFQVGGAIARPKKEFGLQIGPIVMTKVNCKGHEKSLSECGATRWDGQHSLPCNSSLSAAGVICGCPLDVPQSVLSFCRFYTNFPYDRYYCRHSCPTGQVLVGSRKRKCKGMQKWSGVRPTCIPVSSNLLRPICRLAPENRLPCLRLGSLYDVTVADAERCISSGCCFNSSVASPSERCFLPANSPCGRRPCLNGGKCEDGFGNADQYRCVCPRIYTGTNCEVLLNWTCGEPKVAPDLRPLRPQFRIMGGTGAKMGSWPWIVQLRNNGSFFCSGSLITPQWVITAAHCFSRSNLRNGPINSSTWTVVSGQYNSVGYDVTSQTAQIGYILSHNYTTINIPRNDITLLKLRTPLNLDNFSSPICLPFSRDEKPSSDSKCWIAGWGSTSGVSDMRPSVIQQADIPIISSKRCRQINHSSRFYQFVRKDMICGGYKQGGVDACMGDSGGPLMCPRPDGSWYLAGIISWGYECGRPNAPGIYTRVSHFLDWIYNNLQAA